MLNNSSMRFAFNLLTIVVTVIVLSCIQGPWEYEPEDSVLYRGLFVTGYVIADKPVEDFCVDKLLALDEFYTNAFNFYSDFDLTISGKFSGGVSEISLKAHPNKSNCFVGPDSILSQTGEDYLLKGSITWDSSGNMVTTLFEVTAFIPQMFAISDTARAPGLALSGGLSTDLSDTANALSLTALFGSLPTEAQTELENKYGEALIELSITGDEQALEQFMIENGQDITNIINSYNVMYEDGDTLYYMTGASNQSSHFFNSTYSDDVGTILVTHRWDTTGGRPERFWDDIFPFHTEPDTSDFHTSGSIQRRNVMPNAIGEDWTLFDSIPFFNFWFYQGLNTIYFYGMEDAYFDYIERTIQNANNSKVTPFYNVEGAAGIFVGGIVDSFKVTIEVDSFTNVYSLPRAKALYCGSDKKGNHDSDERYDKIGWERESFCRQLYSSYCSEVNWEDPNCGRDFIKVNFVQTYNADSLQKALDLNDAQYKNLTEQAKLEYCIENNFPSNADCETSEKECLSDNINNVCKDYLWTWCLDNKWLAVANKPTAQCGPGLVTYCSENNINSDLLCGKADEYCVENSSAGICN